MTLYNAGNAYLQVVPSFDGIEKMMQREVAKLAKQIDDAVGKGVKDGMRSGATEARKGGERAGEEFAGSFASQFKRRVDAAFKSLGPAVPVTADTKKLDKELNKVREQLDEFRQMDITPNIDQREIRELLTGLDGVTDRLKDIQARAGKDQDLFNVRAALSDLDAFQGLVAKARERGQEAGEVFAGALAEKVQKSVGDALKTLPKYEITADSTPAQKEIARLRSILEELDSKTIGIDVDTGTAIERIRAVNAALEEIRRNEADAEVQANTAAAMTRLAAVLAMIQRIDGQDAYVEVHADTDRAWRSLAEFSNQVGVSMSRLGYLISTGASLGTAIVPAAAAASVAIAGIGTAALAGIAGLGVLGLGLSGVGDAVKALHNYQMDADKSAKSLSQSQNQIASAADSVRSAERGLAQTRMQIAEQEREAQQRIADAVRDVAKAREDAARSVQEAVRRQIDADRDYREAIVDQREAREALNEAYRDAVRALAELDSAVRKNALDQRQAILDTKRAKEELNKLLTNPRATEEEREQARITYERRIIQIEDAKRRGQELAEQQAKANKEGVEGQKVLVNARKKLETADRQVAKAQQAAADARAAVTRAQLDGAERVADASRKESEARREAVVQQRQAQFQLAAAQQSLAAAQRNMAQAYVAAGTAGGAALDTLNEKMAALTPAGRNFAKFIYGLRDEFLKLKGAAESGLLPGLQRGLEKLVVPTRIQGLADYIYRVADAVGDLFDKGIDKLNDPTWQRFGQFISRETVPALETMFTVAENVARGIAGLLISLSGFNSNLSRGIVGMSESFANWATTLDQNQGFQEFLRYVQDNGPMVVELIREMAVFAFRLVAAAAPIGAVVVTVFERLFELLNRIPQKDLTAIVAGIAAAAVAFGIAAAATAALASTTGLVIAAIALAATELILYYNHFEGFRKAVDATFRGIAAVAMWLWRNVLKPAFEGIAAVGTWVFQNILVPLLQGVWERMKDVGSIAMWLWKNALVPALQVIGAVALWLWQNALGPAFRAIGAVVTWLWTNVLKPILSVWSMSSEEIGGRLAQIWGRVEDVFRSLGAAAVWLYDRTLGPAFRAIGAVALWLWQKVIKPVFDGLAVAISVAWTIIRPIYEALKLGVWAVGQGFLAFYRFVIKPVWQGVQIAVQVAWAIIRVIFGLFQIAVKALGLVVVWFYRIVVKPTFDLIVSAIRLAWLIGVKPILDLFVAGFKLVGKWAKWLYDEAIKPAFNWIKSHISDTWRNHIKPVFDTLGTFIRDKVAPVFKAGVTAIGKAWEGLRDAAKKPVKFVIEEILNKGLLAGYNYLAKTFKVTPDNVKINLPAGFAVGGEITGPGTGTSDSVLIRASRGEHMWTAREVQAAGGHGAMYALRQAVLRGHLPGFARGGAIGGRQPRTGDGIGDWLSKTAKNIGKGAGEVFKSITNFLADPIKSLKDVANGLFAKIPGSGSDAAKILLGMPKKILSTLVDKAGSLFTGGDLQVGEPWKGNLGNGGGGGGWQWQMSVLRSVFPGLQLISGPRPGDRTLSGSISYHSSGRAVDLPPTRKVAEWIAETFGKRTLELITPWRDLMLWNGRPTKYSTAIEAQHGVFGNNAHIHWAYDQGGYLPPGLSTVYNGTGRPEPVLTSQQWQEIRSSQSTGGAGDSYHFDFANTTLTPALLEARKQRQDALNRVRRRNR